MAWRKKTIGHDLAATPRREIDGKSTRRKRTSTAVKFSKPGNACVYALEARGTDRIKIGVARNPYSRMTTLQTGCPSELGLLYAVETEEGSAYKIETAIRRAAHQEGALVRGEWVSLPPCVIPVIVAEAAARVGAVLIWRAGSPGDVEPDDFEQGIDASQRVPNLIRY